ncbi:TIGR02270 family protein [Roseateles amylovorans]|uniref:TIGR02270 family protein n=1 Tax=Roseateles amylovorans TaxID=2978473 RepID=A0ABY6B1R4_9BURK|nr:TIGR02270 family protein [Roseateles amylovorans]UXH78780.1 TIGR02270 family protein [Roseateles amylovorans]
MTAVIEDMVAQYAEQTAFLWTQRVRAVQSAGRDLASLADLDERLAAHLEGLYVAAAAGWRHAHRALQERPQGGEAFTAAALALQVGDAAGLDGVLALAPTQSMVIPGIAAAFGWVDPALLRGIVLDLIQSTCEVRRLIGVWALALHRVDPRASWAQLLADPSPTVRARALRLAGEVGALHQRDACLDGLTDDDANCRNWAAWSSALLGDRGRAIDALKSQAEQGAAGAGLDLLLQIQAPDEAHAWLKGLAGRGADLRVLLRASGRVGDPAYVPWLLSQMQQPATARLAGESFALITGADFREPGLRGRTPEGFEAGPNDDPEDPEVESDPDADLPWPDPQAAAKWWTEARHRLPSGQRRWLGQAPTRTHLLTMLTEATQRHRAVAATALALGTPGRPLFDVCAPAPRQRALLALSAG